MKEGLELKKWEKRVKNGLLLVPFVRILGPTGACQSKSSVSYLTEKKR